MPVDVKVVLVGERLGARRPVGTAIPTSASCSASAPTSSATCRARRGAQRRYAERRRGHRRRARGCCPPTADALGALVEEGVALAGRRDRLIDALLRRSRTRARGVAPGQPARGGRHRPRGRRARAAARREQRDGAMEERCRRCSRRARCWSHVRPAAVGQRQRPVGLRPRLPRVRQADPHHGLGRAGPGRHHQRRARGASSPADIYDKGVLIISRLPAPPLRRPRLPVADREPRLRAVLRRRRRRLGLDRRGRRAAVGDLRPARSTRRLAITGSINQHGDVQPVGGVDHKLRGFHALCRGARAGRQPGRRAAGARTCAT